MSFDEIVKTVSEYNNNSELTNLELVNNQRTLASEIIAGHLFSGFEMTDVEHRFVAKCNRSMKPLDKPTLSVLKKINQRRWS